MHRKHMIIQTFMCIQRLLLKGLHFY